MRPDTIPKATPTARPGPVAVKSGLIHLVLAGCCMAVATWLAVSSSGGKCNDTASCLEVGAKFVSFNLIGYAVTFALWSIALHQLLGSVSRNAARRTSSAAAFQLVMGSIVLLGGIAFGEPWVSASAVVAVLLLPAAVAWWATSRPETDEVYLAWWSRPGW